MGDFIMEQYDDFEIDNAKLLRMMVKVHALERENSKTGLRSDKKMKEIIQEIIETEAKK